MSKSKDVQIFITKNPRKKYSYAIMRQGRFDGLKEYVRENREWIQWIRIGYEWDETGKRIGAATLEIQRKHLSLFIEFCINTCAAQSIKKCDIYIRDNNESEYIKYDI